MKVEVQTKVAEKMSIQDMSIGALFRFPSKSFEHSYVDGDLFLKIQNKTNLPNLDSLERVTTYVRLSGNYEFVQRTGPIMGIELEWDYQGSPTTSVSFTTLVECSVGDVVNFNGIITDMYMIVTDTVETNKMISLLDLTTYKIIKLSPQSECRKYINIAIGIKN